MQKSLRCKDSRLGFGILILFGISLVILNFGITRLSALQDPEKDSEIHAALSSLNWPAWLKPGSLRICCLKMYPACYLMTEGGHACNLHSVFYHGTVEWRLFNSTLHAGEVRANIILAMAISAQAINQKYTQFKKTPVGDNPAFTFRTFLLRLGLIGPEYKNVRMHLLKNLPGNKAWRHDKSLYPSNQPRPRTDEVR